MIGLPSSCAGFNNRYLVIAAAATAIRVQLEYLRPAQARNLTGRTAATTLHRCAHSTSLSVPCCCKHQRVASCASSQQQAHLADISHVATDLMPCALYCPQLSSSKSETHGIDCQHHAAPHSPWHGQVLRVVLPKLTSMCFLPCQLCMPCSQWSCVSPTHAHVSVAPARGTLEL
jgi:hypothetical protein